MGASAASENGELSWAGACLRAREARASAGPRSGELPFALASRTALARGFPAEGEAA